MNNFIKPAFAESGWPDYVYWTKHDRRIIKRINKLIKSIYRDGFLSGIGKPEKLRYEQGYQMYSRRIDQKDRLIYFNYRGIPIIVSCKGHYN